MKDITKFLLPHKDIVTFAECSFISDDLILLDRPAFLGSLPNEPFKTKSTMVIFLLKGEMRGQINGNQFSLNGANVIAIVKGQRLTLEYASPDTECLFVIMSENFIEELNLDKAFYLTIRKCPFRTMTANRTQNAQNFFKTLYKAATVQDNPYRTIITQDLARTYFYGRGYYTFLKGKDAKSNSDPNEQVMKQFLHLVRTHGKRQHSVDFYAQQLRFAPKYLSEKIKQESGQTAKEWITENLVREAKSLLRDKRDHLQKCVA